MDPFDANADVNALEMTMYNQHQEESVIKLRDSLDK